MGGRFITLEGPEGAGKTLQAERLATWFRGRGVTVRVTREPGGTPLGEALRELLLHREGPAVSARAEALLFNAARAQLVDEVIAPALARGETVVCARFADSTLAYQGFGSGLPIESLRALATFATRGVVPDLTLLLDVPPEVGLRRKSAGEETRFEAAFDIEFHRRVRDGFLALARGEPDRFRVIDASATPEAVFESILEATRTVA